MSNSRDPSARAAIQQVIFKPDWLTNVEFQLPESHNTSRVPNSVEPDAKHSLDDTSLRLICADDDEPQKDKLLVLFNILAFGGRFDARLTKVIAKKRYSDLARCAMQYYDFTKELVEKMTLKLLRRGIVHTKVDDNGGDVRLTVAHFWHNRARERAGTRGRYRTSMRNQESSSDAPQNAVEVLRKVKRTLPAFLREQRFVAPDKPQGVKSWRRPHYMTKDARVAMHADELEKFTRAASGESGAPNATRVQRRYTIFNIIAFGKAFMSREVGALQANQVSYNQLLLFCERYVMTKDEVDQALHYLLENQLVFVELLGPKQNLVLTASPFLHDVRWADPKEPLTVSIYDRLRINPESKIRTPDFVSSDQYRYVFSDEIYSRSSRFTMASRNVADYLCADDLRKIHPNLVASEDVAVDSERFDDSQMTLTMFNFIVFGANNEENDSSGLARPNEVTIGQLYRLGMDAGWLETRVAVCLKDLLDSGVVNVRYKSDRQYVFTAFPFIGNVQRMPQSERIEREKRLRRDGRRLADERRRSLPVQGFVEVTDHDGRPQWDEYVVEKQVKGSIAGDKYDDSTSSDGMDDDITVQSASSTQYSKANDDSFKSCRILNANNIYSNHLDMSLPMKAVRRMVQSMLDECSYRCALCMQPMLPINIYHIATREEHRILINKSPFQPSLNIIDPSGPTRFDSIEQCRQHSCMVHLCCNYAQHTATLYEARRICSIIASRYDNVDGIATGLLQQQPVGHVPQIVRDALYQSGRQHNLQREHVDVLIDQLVTPESFGGLTVGCGPQFDVDLENYGRVHPLLRLSVDRQDSHAVGNQLHNYRIIPLVYNYVMNDFAQGDRVLERWRLNLIGPPMAPPLTFSSQILSLIADSRPQKRPASDFSTSQTTSRRRVSHECEYDGCEKSYETPSAMQSHIRLAHTGERPYQCVHDDCEARFTSHQMLRQHLKSKKHTSV